MALRSLSPNVPVAPRAAPGKADAAGRDLDHEAKLWQQVWEAKSEKKELERFICGLEAQYGMPQNQGGSRSGHASKDLVDRIQRLIAVRSAASVGSNRRYRSPADETLREIQLFFGHTPKSNRAGNKPRRDNFHSTSLYKPRKHSLTTFEFANTPTNSGTRVLTARPAWQPDHAATECPSCRSVFSMWNRRHHCRACGGLFDDKCCDNMVRIFSLRYDKPVRVCKFCLPVVVRNNMEQQCKSTHGPYECSIDAAASRRGGAAGGERKEPEHLGNENDCDTESWTLDADLKWRRRQGTRRLFTQSQNPAPRDERYRENEPTYRHPETLDMRGYRRTKSAAVDLVCNQF